MLAKHRWLTVVGGLAMAVAIALGASAFEVISVLLRDDLPFPGGDRVVAISTHPRRTRARTGAFFTRSPRGAARSRRRAPRRLPDGAAQPDRAERTSRTDRRRRDHRLGVRPRGHAAASRTLPSPLRRAGAGRARPRHWLRRMAPASSAPIQRSSDARSHLAVSRPPSSGSCLKASRSRSATSSGFRCDWTR